MKINYINTYQNIRSPKVESEIDVYTFLESVQNPSSKSLSKINTARGFYRNGQRDEYEKSKSTLPCYTLNFSFKKYKKNENIIGSTGFMYIDIDDEPSIDLTNPYIFASWKSLSNNGTGNLVRFQGLTKDNFKENYEKVAKILNINADKHASKATQYNIQSYDKNLYYNDNSIVLESKELQSSKTYLEDVTFSTIKRKEKKDRTESSTFGNIKIRYNSIDEYDFSSTDYLFFRDEKEAFYEIYIPFVIPKGSRNNTIYAIGCQYRGLNTHITSAELFNFISYANQRCKPPMTSSELRQISISIMNIKDIVPERITPRRILFNPKKKMDRKEKTTICNRLVGERRSQITQNKILDVIENWNEDEDGRKTNSAIAKKLGIDRATVGRHLKKIELDKL